MAARIEFGGESLTIPQWARRAGVAPRTLRHRLADPDWTLAAALTTPPQRAGRKPDPDGLRARAAALGRSRNGLWKRERREPPTRCVECRRPTLGSLDGEPCCARCARELTTPARRKVA